MEKNNGVGFDKMSCRHQEGYPFKYEIFIEKHSLKCYIIRFWRWIK